MVHVDTPGNNSYIVCVSFTFGGSPGNCPTTYLSENQLVGSLWRLTKYYVAVKWELQ